MRNLELAGYANAKEIADGMFMSLGRVMAAVARFPGINRENIHHLIRYEGLEHYAAAKAKGRGVLIATAHLGNWELSAFAHALMTEPMHIVVRPLENQRVDDWVERRRALSGNHIISKREAAREILRALKAGDAVGILIDQNVVAAEGVFIDFFGRKACAGTAFVKLARHSQAPVIPGFAVFEEKESRYVLRFYPEIEMTGDVLEDTQRVHSLLESAIRQYPDQWLWAHRRWKTRPPGEPDLYQGL